MRALKWIPLLALVVLVGLLVYSDSEPPEKFAPVKVESLKTMELDLGNNVKMKFVLIPKGKFQMGATASEPGHLDKEGPRHEVTLTRPFWLGVTEVTQKQYESVIGENPSYTKGADHPVEFISWQDAQKFCARLSEKTGKHVRLPSEAEWEYGCRAGTETPWFWGSSPRDIGRYAVYKDNRPGISVTDAVGKKLPNPWGLYDIIGNVFELVQDIDTAKYDPNDNVDPLGGRADVGIKIARGGSMNYGSDQCRSAYRLAQGLTVTLFEVGFRVAVDP